MAEERDPTRTSAIEQDSVGRTQLWSRREHRGVVIPIDDEDGVVSIVREVDRAVSPDDQIAE
jgi:hypothetical protein